MSMPRSAYNISLVFFLPAQRDTSVGRDGKTMAVTFGVVVCTMASYSHSHSISLQNQCASGAFLNSVSRSFLPGRRSLTHCRHPPSNQASSVRQVMRARLRLPNVRALRCIASKLPVCASPHLLPVCRNSKEGRHGRWPWDGGRRTRSRVVRMRSTGDLTISPSRHPITAPTLRPTLRLTLTAPLAERCQRPDSRYRK